MDKDTKVLLMAVVIILVALVSFNLTDLTGMVGRSTTVMAVSPTMVSFGLHDTAKIITITVDPSDYGVNKKIILNRVGTGGRDHQLTSETANICTKDICRDIATFSYRLDSELKPGRYYFEAEKRVEGKLVKYRSNIFEIR